MPSFLISRLNALATGGGDFLGSCSNRRITFFHTAKGYFVSAQNAPLLGLIAVSNKRRLLEQNQSLADYLLQWGQRVDHITPIYLVSVQFCKYRRHVMGSLINERHAELTKFQGRQRLGLFSRDDPFPLLLSLEELK